MHLEPRREGVQRGVSGLAEEHHTSVLAEHVEVMPDGLVVEAEELREIIRIVRPLPERVEDPRAVQAAAGRGDQVPETTIDRTPSVPRVTVWSLHTSPVPGVPNLLILLS